MTSSKQKEKTHYGLSILNGTITIDELRKEKPELYLEYYNFSTKFIKNT